MKKLHTLIQTIGFCLLIGISATAQQTPLERKIKIDPRTAMGGIASAYLRDVRFTVFDTDPKAVFGNIDQLEITQQYYLILDRDTKSVLIFDRQGGFHARIEGEKISPQRPNFYSFFYNRDAGTISINLGNELCIFDMDGKLIERKKINFLNYRGPGLYLGNGYVGSYQFSPQIKYKKKDSIAYQLMVTKNGKLVEKHLPYATNIPYDDSKGSQLGLDLTRDGGKKDTLYFTRDYDYRIYQLTSSNMTSPYQFMFPASNSLPVNFLTDTLFNSKRVSFLSTNKVVIYKLGNFYTSGNRILFRTISSDYKNLSYIYDLNAAKLVSLNNIVSDQSTYFLPITDAETGGTDFVNHGIIASDGDAFYTSYSSGLLFWHLAANKSKKIKYPENLRQYFSKKTNQKSNPVLVQFRLKERI